MDYNVQIAISIFNDRERPDKLVEMIGELADRQFVRGERDSIRVVPRNSGITYYSKARQWESSLDEHWNNLSNRLSSKKHAIKQAAIGGEVEITIIVYHTGRFPSLFLEKSFVAFAAFIDASVDIDVYE